MNNEPVAYGMLTFCKNCGEQNPYAVKTLTDDPLVNFKPVWQEKPELTLTDEEIIDIAKEHIHQRLEGERFGYVDFARAILRKAQEK
jgi:hypothetical protein